MVFAGRVIPSDRCSKTTYTAKILEDQAISDNNVA